MGLFRKKQPQMPMPMPMPEQDIASQQVLASAASMKAQEMFAQQGTPFQEYLYEPGELPENHPVILSNKVLALSNLHGRDDIDYVMAHVDDLETNHKLFTPKRSQTKEAFNMFDSMRLFAFLQAQRSTGEKDRDRALLTLISTFQDKPTPQMHKSILTRMREMK